MTISTIQTDQAPAPVGPYSQAIAATGQLIFVSGQIALDPATGTLVSPDDVLGQTHQVFANIKAVLAAAGVGLDAVVKVTVFLKDLSDFGGVNEIYQGYFDGAKPPARACVEAARLPKDAKIEIECIAVADP